MKQKYFGIDFDKYSRELEAEPEKQTPLNLSCRKENGSYGVWLDMEDLHFLVNPIDFFNTFLADDENDAYDDVSVYEVNGKKLKDAWGWVQVFDSRIVYIVTVFNPETEKPVKAYYHKDSYFKAIKKALTDLYEMWIGGNPVLYDEKAITIDAVRNCVEQLRITTINQDAVENDVKPVIERFVFEPAAMYGYDRGFVVGFGERRYTFYTTNYNEEMESVRHELEGLTFHCKAFLSFPYDEGGTETKIVLHDDFHYRDGFRHEYCLLVTIYPNDYSGMPVLTGFCDSQQAARAIYEGLLQMALLHGKDNVSGKMNKRESLVAYNRYKSPIFEINLKQDEYDRRVDSYECLERQTHIKDVLTLRPDRNRFLTGIDETLYNDEELKKLCGKPINVEDSLVQWCIGFVPDVDDDYLQRGFELARLLRNLLPKEYDIWYHVPSDDPNSLFSKPMLVIE